jgi:hypothetical protein
MALAGALCHQLHAVAGFTSKTLRALVAAHLGQPYNQRRMATTCAACVSTASSDAYHTSNPYVLTPDGLRVAVF